MTQVAFDSLASTKRLKDNGFSENQAEAITMVIKDGLEGDIATKADIVKLESELSKSIAETNSNLSEFKIETNNNLSEFKIETNSNLSEFKIETNNNFATIQTKINDMDERFDKIDVRFDKMDTKVTELANDVTQIKSNFKWVYTIGGAIVILLVLPWIAETFVLISS